MANEMNQFTFGGVTYNLEDHRIPSIVDAVYPVGSLYMNVNLVNPGAIFGGTWERINDTFLLAAGQTYVAGDTGGEATHTLTVDEMPQHAHYPRGSTEEENGTWAFGVIQYIQDHSGALGVGTGTGKYGFVSDRGYNDLYLASRTSNTGGDQPHNNMPPYLVVYVWKRTA